MILAIDPGTESAGLVLLSKDCKIIDAQVLPNPQVLEYILDTKGVDYLAIEQVKSYGMAVGETTFRTVEWSGRFIQQWLHATKLLEDRVLRLPRLEIKLHLCQSPRANDGNIRQALIDRLGAPGSKREPGVTYNIKTHMWAALAVAITAHDRIQESEK
jgi:hypothetical protein